MNRQGVQFLVGVVLLFSMTTCTRVRFVERGRDVTTVNRGFSIPLIDLANETQRQIVVDKEEGQLAVLLRENSRTLNSFIMFSDDEGRTWSTPREVPGALTGDRHTAKYAPDGRLFISFRDTAHETPTQGDWVGAYEDLVEGREGQYRVRLMDNKHRWDTAYPGVEILPDGTFVVTTYGHWDEGQEPYIVSVRFTLEELDEKAAAMQEE